MASILPVIGGVSSYPVKMQDQILFIFIDSSISDQIGKNHSLDNTASFPLGN